jgi:hypothetical protein
MDWQSIQVIARAILQGLAGILVSKGLLDGAGAETLIGAVLGIGSVVWSLVNKKQLLNTPPPPPQS